MELPDFHYFPGLPMHTWDIYEANRPHLRHYFRKVYGQAHMYAAEDYMMAGQNFIYPVATAEAPNQTKVPDPALTPGTKIQRSGDYVWFNFMYNHDYIKSASTLNSTHPFFRRVKDPLYIWANFKLDTFCFTSIAFSSNEHDMFGYLQGSKGISSTDFPDKLHRVFSHPKVGARCHDPLDMTRPF